MLPPALNEHLQVKIGGRVYNAVCTDVFDGGFGWYIDATLPKRIRYRFSAGERCAMPERGKNCLADFVSYPTNELWKVRLLLSKASGKPAPAGAPAAKQTAGGGRKER